jgi:hypothetical protein
VTEPLRDILDELADLGLWLENENAAHRCLRCQSAFDKRDGFGMSTV